MKGSFLFLGTGGSMGVPVIGCTCATCSSPSAFNKRLRPSGLVRLGNKQFLIDAGPDFREQALREKIMHLDGILLTHTHFDHIAGLDDLRVFTFLQPHSLPCLLSEETLEEIKVRYHYLMQYSQKKKSPYAQLDFQVLEGDFGKTVFEGFEWEYLSYFQAKMKVTGFRLGSFAYVSDIREYDQRVFRTLEGVETLVLSALRHTPSEVHFSLEEAIDFVRKVGAKRAFFTHIAHELEHEETNRSLPSDIRLGHDGLQIEFSLSHRKEG